MLLGASLRIAGGRRKPENKGEKEVLPVSLAYIPLFMPRTLSLRTMQVELKLPLEQVRFVGGRLLGRS